MATDIAFAFGVILLMRRNDVQSLAPYLAVGAFLWLALLESGVHAIIAGTLGYAVLRPNRDPSQRAG